MDKIDQVIETLKELKLQNETLKEKYNALKEENCELTDKLDDSESEKKEFKVAYDGLFARNVKLEHDISQLRDMVDQGNDPIIPPTIPPTIPSTIPSTIVAPAPPTDKYSAKEKMEHFRDFLIANYVWIEPENIPINKKFANIPFEYILNDMKKASGSNPRPKMKGKEAYYPAQQIMLNKLREKQTEKYGRWECGSKGVIKYNGTYGSGSDWKFDLKRK